MSVAAKSKPRLKRSFLRPLGARVIVRREDAEDASPGGIALPEDAQERKQFGTVLAVGPGKALADGTRMKMSVEVGDIVVFGVYAETITLRDDEFIVLNEDDIYAVFERE